MSRQDSPRTPPDHTPSSPCWSIPPDLDVEPPLIDTEPSLMAETEAARSTAPSPASQTSLYHYPPRVDDGETLYETPAPSLLELSLEDDEEGLRWMLQGTGSPSEFPLPSRRGSPEGSLHQSAIPPPPPRPLAPARRPVETVEVPTATLWGTVGMGILGALLCYLIFSSAIGGWLDRTLPLSGWRLGAGKAALLVVLILVISIYLSN